MPKLSEMRLSSAIALAGALDEGEDEGRCHRSGCDAAGIEGDADENFRDEKGQCQRDEVARQQIVPKLDFREYDPQHRQGDGRADSQGQNSFDRIPFDSAVRDVLDLVRQDMDGRFRQDGDQTEHKADHKQI